MKVIPTLVGTALLHTVSAGAQGSIAGTVYDSLRTGAPLAHATVVLVERSQYTTTDGHGRFHMDSVPDGHYTLGFMHPVLDSLDLTAPVVTVDVTGSGRTKVALFTPSAAAAYARVCPGEHDIETGVVIGRVRDVDDQAPLANAIVATDWTEFTLSEGRAASHRVRAIAKTDRDGLYRLCGVPTTVPVDVHTELGGFGAGPIPVSFSDRLIARLDFTLSRHDSAARATQPGDSSAIASRAPGTASLRGRVLGGGGRPMRDVVVAVAGAPLEARTDATGAFRVDRIPAGTRAVEVRSIGLVPMHVSMEFATNASRDTTLSVGKQAQPLKAVAVVGQVNTLSWMEREGFEVRRRQGLGDFATAADIARRGGMDLISVLQPLRGVRVDWGGSGRTAGIALPMPYLLGIGNAQGSLRCTPNFFLDGAPFQVGSPEEFADLSAMLPLAYVKGVEVYSTAGAIPPQYDMSSSTGCGSIVIWSR